MPVLQYKVWGKNKSKIADEFSNLKKLTQKIPNSSGSMFIMITDITKFLNTEKVEIKSCDRYEYCILQARVSNDIVT